MMSIPHRLRLKTLSLFSVLFMLSLGQTVHAGGGPETTLVVVNARSALSQRIANEYMHLRQIPATHLLRLPGIRSTGTISVNALRRDILTPIQDFIREHHLEDEIDLIAYSGDFPYAVDFSADLKANKVPRSRYLGTLASLTSMTYFAARVQQHDPGYLGQNHYFRDFVSPEAPTDTSVPAADTLNDKERNRLKREAEKALKQNDFASAAASYQRIAESEPRRAKSWFDLASAQASGGQHAQALTSLTRAVENGWSQSYRVRGNEAFAPLRDQPGFEALLQRMDTAYGPFLLTHGFRHDKIWSNADLKLWDPEEAKDRYYLSMMLAYTGARGNSLPEVLDYLRKGKASDGTQPDGTVYLMENTNVRSETRQPLFTATRRELAERGRKAEILSQRDEGQDGILPKQRSDVIGAVVGTQVFDWARSDSQMLPGAIAESLTSFGGDFVDRSQTKLTAFLRAGAAGSSGAVQEPYAIQAKFPVPLIHAYYADGCSLTEAFYQSLQAPYQMILVGDPLARPFARLAELRLLAPDTRTPWSGSVSIQSQVSSAADHPIATVELWIDGQRLLSARPNQTIRWDTRNIEDGEHALRLVAVEDGRIETRSGLVQRIWVSNHPRHIQIDRLPDAVDFDGRLSLSGHAEGAVKIELLRGDEILTSSDVVGDAWRMSVPSSTLGTGPVEVQVRAQYPDGLAVRGALLPVSVREPPPRPATTQTAPADTGLQVILEDAAGSTRETTIEKLDGALRSLVKKGQPALKRIQLNGLMQVQSSGLQQLSIRSDGHLKVVLGGKTVFIGPLSRNGQEALIPMGLAAGWHRLEIELEPNAAIPFLDVVLSGQDVPESLEGKRLGHCLRSSGEPASDRLASRECL